MEWTELRDFLNTLTPEQNCRVDKMTGRHWPIINSFNEDADDYFPALYRFIYDVAHTIKSGMP